MLSVLGGWLDDMEDDASKKIVYKRSMNKRKVRKRCNFVQFFIIMQHIELNEDTGSGVLNFGAEFGTLAAKGTEVVTNKIELLEPAGQNV